VIDQSMADETEQALQTAAHSPEVRIERAWYY